MKAINLFFLGTSKILLFPKQQVKTRQRNQNKIVKIPSRKKMQKLK